MPLNLDFVGGSIGLESHGESDVGLAIWTRILTRPKKKNALVLMSSGQLSLKK
jgi:hypothetical protein